MAEIKKYIERLSASKEERAEEDIQYDVKKGKSAFTKRLSHLEDDLVDAEKEAFDADGNINLDPTHIYSLNNRIDVIKREITFLKKYLKERF